MAETKKAAKPEAPKHKIVVVPEYRVHTSAGKAWTVQVGRNEHGAVVVEHVCATAPCGSSFAARRDDLRYLCESILKILDENK